MTVLLLIAGCFTLYGKSKYFIKDFVSVGRFLRKHIPVARVAGYLMLAFSALLIFQYYDAFTATMIFTSAVMLCFSLLIVLLNLHKNFIYLFGITGVISLIIDFANAS
ncbi:MAG: hypothetical protein WBA74_22325 [Cyclobacteriaceae bacterium]